MEIDFAYFSEKIQQTLGEIEKDIERLKTSSQPISPDNAIGRLSRMDAINAKSIAEAALRNVSVRQIRLKAAIERIKDATYGECLTCGEAIAIKRLTAIPEATQCIRCADHK